MALDDTSDLWWLKDRPEESLAGFGLGIQMANIAQHNNYLRQLQAEQIRQRMELARAKALADVERSKGMAEMSRFMSQVDSTKGWGDPANRAKLWDIGARYPNVYDHNTIQGLYKNFTDYDERIQKAQSELQTTATKNEDAARAALAKAAQWEAIGNTEEAQSYRDEAARLQSAVAGKNLIFESYTDESGQQQWRMIQGPAQKPVATLTTAATTRLQNARIGYEAPIATINHIQKNMQASDFGLRGVVGELMDRYGAQILPELADPRRVSVRNSMRNLRADLYTTLRSDSNISEPERKEITRMLPTPDIDESLPDAAQKLIDAKDKLVLKDRNAAAKLGVLPAPWAMTPTEISDAWRKGLDAIKKGADPTSPQFKAKFITQEDAIRYMKLYFPELVNPTANQGAPAPSPYGKRQDQTEKGAGFFGELKRPDGRISTELSIGVNFDGKEREIPSLVPTLTKAEIDHLLAGGKPTAAIVDKAVAHARQRIKAGKSPFAEAGEQVSPP